MKAPFLAQALLLAVAGRAEAECVAGDLEEEYAQLCGLRGSFAATRWYVSQVLRSVLPLMNLRVRSGELTAVALAAAAGVAAPLLLLDRVWRFVYSQIPLKDGLDRAPLMLALNVACVCLCAALAGLPAKSSGEGAIRALASGGAAAFALWISAAAAPPLYLFTVPFGAAASTLLTFHWRQSK